MTSEEDLISPQEEFLYDFLYVDQAKIASYCAQLFPNGVHVSTKTSASSYTSRTDEISAGIPKVIGTEAISTETLQNSIERQFDASWHRTLNFLRELNKRQYIQPLSEASLGQIAIIKGEMLFLDIRMIQGMWDDIINLLISQMPNMTKNHKQQRTREKENAKYIANIAKNLPHTAQVRFCNEKVSAWATLIPEYLTINASDIAFKHGAQIPGIWNVICVVDALPNVEDSDLSKFSKLNDLESPMLQMMLALKTFFGRSSENYGITPLAIYRPINKT